MKACRRRKPAPSCKSCGRSCDRRRRPGRTQTGFCRACYDQLDILSREEARRHGTCGLEANQRMELRRRSAEALAAGQRSIGVDLAALDALLNASTNPA